MSFLPETKDERLRCFRDAINNWAVFGYVTFTARVEDWLRRELPDLSASSFKQLLFEFVDQGAAIDERKEQRPEYTSFEYWYRLRMPVNDRLLFVEIILDVEDPDDRDGSTIMIVSVHDE